MLFLLLAGVITVDRPSTMSGVMWTLVLLACVCINAMPEGEDIVGKCWQDAGLTEDELKDLHKPMPAMSGKKYCFLGCLYEKRDFFENKEQIAETVEREIKEESVRKRLHECYMRIERSDPCQLGSDIYSCIKEAGLE